MMKNMAVEHAEQLSSESSKLAALMEDQDRRAKAESDAALERETSLQGTIETLNSEKSALETKIRELNEQV